MKLSFSSSLSSSPSLSVLLLIVIITLLSFSSSSSWLHVNNSINNNIFVNCQQQQQQTEPTRQRATLTERKVKLLNTNSNVKNINRLNNDQINNRNIKIKSSKKQFTKPFTKFIQWRHCYDEEDSLISLTTSYLTIVPTVYNTPGVKIEMDVKFNEPIMETNQLFYNLELWHEETGQKIKYRGPYDICCGSFLGNESKNNLEIGCQLEESNCPIINLNKTYHITMERPLYSVLDGTHEATLRIYKYQPIEHDPERREMIEHLCLDIPFKVLFNHDKDDNTSNLEWKLSDHSNSLIVQEIVKSDDEIKKEEL